MTITYKISHPTKRSAICLLVFFQFIIAASLIAQPNVYWLAETGSATRCEAISTCFDPEGNILVGGRFSGTVNFDPLGPGFDLSALASSPSNGFVAKYSPEGQLIWAFRLGRLGTSTSDPIFVNAIRSDSEGNVIVSGLGRSGINFDPDGNFVPFLSSQVFRSTFLAKYSPEGNLIWAFQFATNHSPIISAVEDYNYGQRLSIDSDDNIILIGAFQRQPSGSFFILPDFDPGPGEAIPASNGGIHLFLSKYSSDGAFQWFFDYTAINASPSARLARGYSVATDHDGNIWIGGNCIGDIDVDPGPDEFLLVNAPSGSSSFLAKYTPAGGLISAHMLISSTIVQTSRILGIYVDSDNHLYICGRMRGTIDFDPGPGELLLSSPLATESSAYSAYIAKYTSLGALEWARLIGVDAANNSQSQCQSVIFHPEEFVMVAGQFFGQATFNDPISPIVLNSAGGITNPDAFLAGYNPGGDLLWATQWGGTSDDSAHEITVNGNGEVSVVGHFSSSYSINIDGINYPVNSAGNRDLLITKISPTAPYRGGPSDGFVQDGSELSNLDGNSLYKGGSGDGFAEASLGAPFLEVPLPIELLYFHAEADGDVVRTFWETATEINNDYFAVERSDDGYTWDDVGTLKGAGNSTSPQVYSLMDSAPLSGLSYYRLRQVDFDGTFAHSEIRAVFFDQTDGQSLMLYPNPTHREVTVHLNGIDADIETLSIFNLVGQELWKQHGQGQSIEKVDLSSLPSGTYLVQVQSADRVYRKKVVRL